jgi:hypothetical protein
MDYETALNLAQENYDARDYEAIEENVDAGHLKHDTTLYYGVYLRKLDNTYWQVFYACSYNDGFDEDSVEVRQVEKKEVVTVEWEALMK